MYLHVASVNVLIEMDTKLYNFQSLYTKSKNFRLRKTKNTGAGGLVGNTFRSPTQVLRHVAY